MAMAGTMWLWPCLHRVMGDLSPKEVKGVTLLASHVTLGTSGTLASSAHALMLDIPSTLMLPTPLENEPRTLAPSFPNYTGLLRVTQVFSY